MRWLKSITRTEAPTTAPTLITPSRQGSSRNTFTTVADQEKKSLAILPFRNLSNDAASSFYEFSLADAVITELARVRSLVVRPSSVIARYQGQQIDPREIGQELNVNAVLTAGFIHAGERFRVTAQLLDVASGEILWSDRIDTSASDIIAVQDTIAQRIVEGLRLELSPAEQDGIAKPSTQNAAAYEQYLRGRDFLLVSSFARLRLKIATQRSSIFNERSNSIRILPSPMTAWALLTSIAFSRALVALKTTNAPKWHLAKRWQSIRT